MSLPYESRPVSEALTRLDGLGCNLGDVEVTAFRAGVALHSDVSCAPDGTMVRVPLRDWVASDEASSVRFSCICGSFRGTREGSAASHLALSLQAVEADRVKYKAKSWAEIDAFYSLVTAPLSSDAMRPQPEMVLDVASRISSAALSVAERSLTALDPKPLFEAVAVQGLTVPIRPSLGSYFERWAARHVESVTYSSLDPKSSSPTTNPSSPAPLFESALASAMSNTSPAVLVLALHAVMDPATRQRTSRLARMFLLKAGMKEPSPTSDPLACVRLPSALADGLHALLQPSGLSVECGPDPLDEVTLSLASRLWSPSDRGPLSRLDGAVAAARLMK